MSASDSRASVNVETHHEEDSEDPECFWTMGFRFKSSVEIQRFRDSHLIMFHSELIYGRSLALIFLKAGLWLLYSSQPVSGSYIPHSRSLALIFLRLRGEEINIGSDGLDMMMKMMKMFASRDLRDLHHLEEEVQRLQEVQERSANHIALLQEVQERSANHIARLQQQLANKTQEMERLQAELQDYEKIKTELRTLRALTHTALTHTALTHTGDEVFAPPSDSADPVIPSESHHVCGKEEPLSELPVDNMRSSSSSSSSVSLHMCVKEEDTCEEEECDTTGLTLQVKEALQKHSIGQRVFGHCVLGLSQGTVSDILARPKPWRTLTRRGREPFLRMQSFLSDQSRVRALAVTQERLRGIVPWVRPPEMTSDQVIRNILDQNRSELMDVDSGSQRGSEDVIRNILHQAKHEMHVTSETPEEVHYGKPSPSDQSPADFVQSIIRKVKCEMNEDTPPSASPAPLSILTHSFPPEPEPRTQVCVQQVCVGSCEDEMLESLHLDTVSITQRVKEALVLNSIGQRVFGEEVLGLTQSSVSELLSRPKPWTKLSLKGKENFIRMHRWLQDPHNVQRLTKTDQRARLKRDSQRPSDAPGHGFCPSDGSGACEAIKRPRVVLSAREKDSLRAAYQLEPYPSQHTIERLAAQLALQTSTVSNWFYNYRSRIRRDGLPEPVQTRTVQSPASSSPVSSGLLSIKQEACDPEMEDTHQHTCVSVAVQSVTKAEDLEELV
ncbi:homeobox protein cut-like 2 [Rhinichthys klamathensis goyatoka]|uniref:homeobox protein cut-like 2 n=1 Tax=Rhinichthys klamathensis goyatoka TaxID=3034132 RepID=UPI0024B56CDB|nr:homeobox protein cut-like 2 [Rhinichthys klamathensis goyatoka]